MNNQNMKPVNQAPKPVTIERDVNDVVVIEGVRYSASFFRTMSWPETDVLYAIRRDGDAVRLTTVRNPGEAQLFFVQRSIGQEYGGQDDPAPTDEMEAQDGL